MWNYCIKSRLESTFWFIIIYSCIICTYNSFFYVCLHESRVTSKVGLNKVFFIYFYILHFLGDQDKSQDKMTLMVRLVANVK